MEMMKQQIEYCCHERETSQKIVDDIDKKRARHLERIGYGQRIDVTEKVRAREVDSIAAIDAFLNAVGYEKSTMRL
jgi:hypothetical protein